MPLSLSRMPAELIVQILQHLENLDLKQLRLVCRRLLPLATEALRFNRLFISLSTANIETFLAVCGHEYFRRRITEIVWDDCVFPELMTEDSLFDLTLTDRFTKIWQWGLQATGRRFSDPFKLRLVNGQHQPYPSKDDISLYQYYFHEQQENMRIGRDVSAFITGLKSLPNLKRVVLTPDIHNNWQGYQLTEWSTPFTRSMPTDFVLPDMYPWLEDIIRFHYQYLDQPWEVIAPAFRGIQEIARAMAHTPNSVKEFIINASALPEYGGISHRLFESNCPDVSNLKLAFRNLTRIDLSIHGRTDEGVEWRYRSSPFLKPVLDEVIDLHHLSLLGTQDKPLSFPLTQDHIVPLCELLVVSRWPRLETLELGFLYLDFSDFLSFTRNLPVNFQLLTLISVLFRGITWEEVMRFLRSEGSKFRLKRGELRVVYTEWTKPLYVVDEEIFDFFEEKALVPFKDNMQLPARGKYLWKEGRFLASERLETYGKPGILDMNAFSDQLTRHRYPFESSFYQYFRLPRSYHNVNDPYYQSNACPRHDPEDEEQA